MLSILLQGSSAKAFTYCIYDDGEGAQTGCTLSSGDSATNPTGKSTFNWGTTVLLATESIQFSCNMEIGATQYTSLENLLTTSSGANFEISAENLVLAEGVTLTFKSLTKSYSGTFTLPDKGYTIDSCIFTLPGANPLTMNPKFLTGSARFIISNNLNLDITENTVAYTSLFTAKTGMFELSGKNAEIHINLPAAPDKVSFLAKKYTFTFGASNVEIDIPPKKTTFSNILDTLSLDFQNDLTTGLTFNLKNTAQSKIVVSGTTIPTVSSSKITIGTLATEIIVPLPIAADAIPTQNYFVATEFLLLKSDKDVVIYQKGSTLAAQYNNYLSFPDDDPSLDSTFFGSKDITSFSFSGATLETSVFPNLDFSDATKWKCEAGLTLKVTSVTAKVDLNFQTGVTFGAISESLTITNAFAVPFDAISSATVSGQGKIVATGGATVDMSSANVVAAILSCFDATSIVTLEYSDIADFTFVATAVNDATINGKAIDMSQHQFNLATAEDLVSFELTWPTGFAPTKSIGLVAKPNTVFRVGDDFASTENLIKVTFNPAPAPATQITVITPKEVLNMKPFTTDAQGVTFVPKVQRIVCVYTGANSDDCPNSGFKDQDLQKANLNGATSIQFHKECTVDISVFSILDFGSKIYDFAAGTLILGAANPGTHNDIVLTAKVTLNPKAQITGNTLQGPIGSIATGISSGFINIPKVTLTFPDSPVTAPFAAFSSTSEITLKFDVAPTTMQIADGTAALSVGITIGQASFDMVSGQKYIFGDAAATKLTITSNALTGGRTIAAGQLFIPVTGSTSLKFVTSKIDTADYLTLTGVQAQSKLIVVVPAADIKNTPLAGTNLEFEYVAAETSYCFVKDNQQTGCFALTQIINGDGFNADQFSQATYILVIDEVECDISNLAKAGSIVFKESVFKLSTSVTSALILRNKGSTVLTSLTLVEGVHIGADLTTTSLTAPIDSLPTDTTRITTSNAIIEVQAEDQSNPITSDALTKLKEKDGKLAISLKVVDTADLKLGYDATTKVPTFCGNSMTGVKKPIAYLSTLDPVSFYFDVSGTVASDTDLGSVTLKSSTAISLGKGFNTVQILNMLALAFAGEDPTLIKVSTDPSFDDANKPFKTEIPISYKATVPNICIFKTEKACESHPDYTAISTTDITNENIKAAENLIFVEEMSLSIDLFADAATKVIISGDKFSLSGKLTLEISATKTFSLIQIDQDKDVVIVIKEPTANLLATVTPTIKELKCLAKVVDTLKGTAVGTWTIFVDPNDTNTYNIINDAALKVSKACIFQILDQTTASIVFKLSDEEGGNMITVTQSTYTYPAVETTFTNVASGTSTLTEVQVDLIPSAQKTEIPSTTKLNINIESSGTLKVLEGMGTQTTNPFTVSADSYKVLYPSTFKPEDYFIKEGEGVTVDTWSPTQPNPPPKKSEGLAGWAIAVIVIVVVIVVAVVVVLVLNFTGVIHLCGNRDDAPSV